DGEVVLHRRLDGLSVDGVDSDHPGLELLECGAGDLVPRVRVGDAHADQLREGGDVALAPVLDAVDAVGGRGVDGAEGFGDHVLGQLARGAVAGGVGGELDAGGRGRGGA